MALDLAKSLVDVANQAGLPTVALVTGLVVVASTVAPSATNL